MQLSFAIRRIAVLIIVVACVLASNASRALAVGWGPTDFLVFGAPNGPDRIGVFDQNFAFKGYLVSNWFGVQGMNFDAQGHLVVFNSASPEVRVFDSSGAQIGGFGSATSPMLTTGGDVMVMPDGNYIVGTSNGARVFTPQGAFVRQYGSGNSGSIAVLPGDRLWSGNPTTLTMNVFDTVSGDQVGSFVLDQQTRPSYQQYSATTNTVLVIDRDRDAGGVFERDLQGDLLRTFHIPLAQTTCNGATYGPGGDLYGSSSNSSVGIVEWRPDGSVAKTLVVSQFTQTRMVWAGSVPEPSSISIAIGAYVLALRGRRN